MHDGGGKSGNQPRRPPELRRVCAEHLFLGLVQIAEHQRGRDRHHRQREQDAFPRGEICTRIVEKPGLQKGGGSPQDHCIVCDEQIQKQDFAAAVPDGEKIDAHIDQGKPIGQLHPVPARLDDGPKENRFRDLQKADRQQRLPQGKPQAFPEGPVGHQVGGDGLEHEIDGGGPGDH